MQKNKLKSRSVGKPKTARKSKAQTEIRQKNQAAPEPVAPAADRSRTQPTVGATNRQETQPTAHTADKPESQPAIRNTKLQDSGCKIIFEDNT
ncbi:MAG: hypothetical protein NC427_07355, partial [Ruminococcus flavefaciens]|nr:hypothetical protein [Ruminococcus flavefaciens]